MPAIPTVSHVRILFFRRWFSPAFVCEAWLVRQPSARWFFSFAPGFVTLDVSRRRPPFVHSSSIHGGSGSFHPPSFLPPGRFATSSPSLPVPGILVGLWFEETETGPYRMTCVADARGALGRTSRALPPCPRTCRVATAHVGGPETREGAFHPAEAATKRSRKPGTTRSFARGNDCNVRRNIPTCFGKTRRRRRPRRPTKASKQIENDPTNGNRKERDEIPHARIQRRNHETKRRRQCRNPSSWTQQKVDRQTAWNPNRRWKRKKHDGSDRNDPRKMETAANHWKDTGKRSCQAKGLPWQRTCKLANVFLGVEK